MFVAIWLFAPKIPKSGQDASQNGLKLVILRSMMAILGPSWRQVGQLSAILAATWPILAPRCAPTDLQIEPQTRPKSHLGRDLAKNGENKQNDGSSALLKVFWGPGAALGGYVGSSWRDVGLCWASWAPSWSNLATRWRPRAPR